jgi:hypothetical protein
MKRILSRLWPPYAVYLGNREAPVRSVAALWQGTFEDAIAKVTQLEGTQVDDAEHLASAAFDAETKRKDTLESKAATFVVTPAIAVGIAGGIAILMKDLHLSRSLASIIAGAYVLSLIHFLVSSWYAVQARRAEEFVVLSADNAQALASQSRVERIASWFAYTSLNEPALLRKVNRLTVAEDLFLRGLAFLAAASITTLLAFIAHV